MEGKRVPQPETGGEAKKRLPIAGIIAAVLAALLLGAAAGRIVPCQVPGSDRTHRLAVYEKRQKTPAAYPRAAGKPQKQPLL